MPAPMRWVRAFFLVQFLSVAMVNAYGGIWFESIGLSAFQIGIIGAAPVAALLCLTLFVGRLADRARDWRQTILWGSLIGGLIPVALYASQAFWWVLLIWTLLAATQGAVVPVADAAAMRMSRREGADFGSLRALSTIGYLVVILGAGYLLEAWGVGYFLPLFITFGLIRALAAFGLPHMRATTPPQSQPTVVPGAFLRGLKPWFVLPLLGWALIDANHIILNSFQGLLWARQGISTEVIGWLIMLGALAETVMFLAFARLSRRFSPLTILLAAAGFSVLRWVAMAYAPGVPVLIALQMMHALTYGMGFLAIVNFIADHTDESVAAEAQSFMRMLELAVASIALVCFGALTDSFGAGAYLACAALALAGGAAVFMARLWPTAPDKGL